MRPKMRWGVLSTAQIGRLVAQAASRSDRVEIIAVASRDGDRAADFAAQHGIERSYGSYQELLADTDIECVYIPLPNSIHVDWAVRALEAGKHVLCEKPFDRRPAAVQRAFAIAHDLRRYLSEGLMWRHHPQTKTLVTLVAGDEIGRLRNVHASFSWPLDDPRNIRLRPELDGGALMDLGAYCVSALRLFGGTPQRVSGVRRDGPTGTDTEFAGIVEFGEDLLGTFDCSLSLPPRQRLELRGVEGEIVVGAPFALDWAPAPVVLHRGAEAMSIPMPEADSYQCELENFADAVRGEDSLLLGRDDALGQAKVIDALYRAAESRCCVEV